MLDDIEISRAIIEAYYKELLENLELDVAIGGAGPAGLTAAYYLAKQGKKVAVFERKLSVGGGMWGGGMMLNKIVVQKEGKKVLDDLGISTEKYGEEYFVADAVNAVGGLAYQATKAGAKIYNLVSIEDVMIREKRVTGIVVNWSAVELANLHVDPLTVRSKFVVDATGHPLEVVKVLKKKNDVSLNTKTGDVLKENSMWAERGERAILENTKEVYPGLWAAGMACNAVFGGPRMGPIFGGMLLSGKKVAEELSKRLG